MLLFLLRPLASRRRATQMPYGGLDIKRPAELVNKDKLSTWNGGVVLATAHSMENSLSGMEQSTPDCY